MKEAYGWIKDLVGLSRTWLVKRWRSGVQVTMAAAAYNQPDADGAADGDVTGAAKKKQQSQTPEKSICRKGFAMSCQREEWKEWPVDSE